MDHAETRSDSAGKSAPTRFVQPIQVLAPVGTPRRNVFDAIPPGRVVINRKQLLLKVPICERTILDMEKRGDFPKRFSVTPRLVVWDLAEIDEWIARQQAAAVQQPVPGTKRA